ncbi:flavin reductase family protein [Microvirga sp.]|uniref:flavin reductase family protein n=1 Tax=Microvirga sp. TaxID=1873136 RepID=UPI001FEE3272|nr:flavin reductase family protein [Microvirga sp.]
MRPLAGGVTIIATEHEGRRTGLAATAVCSVSADPPTVLICINAGASAHEPIRESGRFSVNLLARGQDDIARLCRKPFVSEFQLLLPRFRDGVAACSRADILIDR